MKNLENNVMTICVPTTQYKNKTLKIQLYRCTVYTFLIPSPCPTLSASWLSWICCSYFSTSTMYIKLSKIFALVLHVWNLSINFCNLLVLLNILFMRIVHIGTSCLFIFCCCLLFLCMNGASLLVSYPHPFSPWSPFPCPQAWLPTAITSHQEPLHCFWEFLGRIQVWVAAHSSDWLGNGLRPSSPEADADPELGAQSVY